MISSLPSPTKIFFWAHARVTCQRFAQQRRSRVGIALPNDPRGDLRETVLCGSGEQLGCLVGVEPHLVVSSHGRVGAELGQGRAQDVGER